jgi:hypothetical protein
MAKKFTADHVAQYKAIKKRLESDLKVLKTFTLWKSQTATNFNKVNSGKFYELYEAGVQIGDLMRELSNIAFKDMKFVSREETPTLSARGWHKDHYNYNKAERHERTPAKRRTPAQNVTRTGAKRKRATSITKYKR